MDRIDSLKYMDIDSELQDLFNSKDSVFLKHLESWPISYMHCC